MIFVTQSNTALDIEQGDEEGPSLPGNALAVLERLGEASPLSDQLRAFGKDIGLRDRELMGLAGVSRATLSRWRKEGEGERPPALDDLRVIAALLIRSGAIRPQSVAGWLRSRNKGLDWNRPIDVLRDGDFAAVLSAAEAACGFRVPVKKIPAGSVADRGASFTAESQDSVNSPPEVAP